jgi:hypothetical protein
MNPFIGIIGEPGSGKTTFITALLQHDSREENRRIIANYHLSDSLSATFMPFDELAKLPDSIVNSVIGMDELGVGADSYDVFLPQNRSLTKLVAQARKFKCFVYYTVQRYNMISVRLRKLTGGFILMEDLDAHISHRAPYVCEAMFKVEFVTPEMVVVRRETFDGKPYQHLFSTDERVLTSPAPVKVKPVALTAAQHLAEAKKHLKLAEQLSTTQAQSGA